MIILQFLILKFNKQENVFNANFTCFEETPLTHWVIYTSIAACCSLRVVRRLEAYSA